MACVSWVWIKSTWEEKEGWVIRRNQDSGPEREEGKITHRERKCHISAVIGERESSLIGVAMAMVGTKSMCVHVCLCVGVVVYGLQRIWKYFVHVGVFVCACVCVCVCMWVCMCLCVCMCVGGGLNEGSCWGIISVVKGKWGRGPERSNKTQHPPSLEMTNTHNLDCVCACVCVTDDWWWCLTLALSTNQKQETGNKSGMDKERAYGRKNVCPKTFVCSSTSSSTSSSSLPESIWQKFKRSEHPSDEEIGSARASTLFWKQHQLLPDRNTPTQTKWECVCDTHVPPTRSRRQRLQLGSLFFYPSSQARCLLTVMAIVSNCLPGSRTRLSQRLTHHRRSK